MGRDISAEIDRLASRRDELWSQGDGEGAGEIAAIGVKLAELYEEKRIAEASAGTPRQRQRAVKRALVERELDRLMQAE